MKDSKIMRALPFVAVVFIALIVWAICYPAFMNGDSLVQYNQALTGNYDDWHPPVMAIILHYVLKLGGGIGFITLLQTVLGCLGIYLLSKQVLQLFGASEKTKCYFPIVLLVFLLTPVTPLAFHLMAFIKDTWVVIGLVWIAYLALHLVQIKVNKLKNYKFFYVLLFIAMLLVMLVRHNAIVLIPVFVLLLFFLSDAYINTGKFHVSGIMPGVYYLAIYFILSIQINAAFKVTKTHPENQVYATECLGVLVNNMDDKKYLPYMYSHLTPIYQKAYIPGNVAPIMWWGPVKAVDTIFNRDDTAFTKQYYSLLTHDLMAIARVKWDGFKMMLRPHVEKQWFHPMLDDNKYGLMQNGKLKGIRDKWIDAASNLHETKLVHYGFGEHSLWILINGAMLLFFFIKRRTKNAMFITVLLLPLTYYASYLLASTGPDFRFMYPATLLVQVITVTLVVALITRKKQALTV